ncbi:MAG: ThuA domain-containing protein [Microthrixaceae bacterium]
MILSGGPAHDFDATSNALAELLEPDGLTSQVVTEPGDAFDAISRGQRGHGPPVDLLTVNALRWRMEVDRYAHLRDDFAFGLTPQQAALIERYVLGGGGLLALHAAVICFDAEPTWRRLCGAAWNWARSAHPPVGPADVQVTVSGRTHPITAGLPDFTITDEVYGFLDEEAGFDPLLCSSHAGRAHPLLWARELGAGRAVTDLLGHGGASLSHPTHRTILRRAALWAVGTTPDLPRPAQPVRRRP